MVADWPRGISWDQAAWAGGDYCEHLDDYITTEEEAAEVWGAPTVSISNGQREVKIN